MIMTNKILNELEPEFILPLISAAAVLRKENYLRKILSHSKQVNLNPRKIYEALLQTYLFAGFPAALISLKIFSEFFELKSSNEIYDITKFTSRGVKNCKKVYGNKFDKLISNVNSFSPELSEWLIIEGYGKTFGRKSLQMKERELCIVSILTALEFEDQLVSHLIGSLRCGNTAQEIEKSLDKLSLIGETKKSGWGIRILKNLVSSRMIKKY